MTTPRPRSTADDHPWGWGPARSTKWASSWPTERPGARPPLLRSRLRRLAHLDIRATAQVADPVEVGALELLFAQHVARLLARLLQVERCLAPLEHLDQVDSEARNHRLRQAVQRQRVERLLELGNEVARRRPAEIAALRRRAVLGVVARDLFEAFRARLDLLLELGQAAQ